MYLLFIFDIIEVEKVVEVIWIEKIGGTYMQKKRNLIYEMLAKKYMPLDKLLVSYQHAKKVYQFGE